MDIPDVDLLGCADQPSVPGRHKRGQRQSLQQHHLLLLHAHKCQQREALSHTEGKVWQCPLARCKKMKKLLNHMILCPLEKKCICSKSRQLMKQFTNCKKEDCPVCVQRKEWQMGITTEQRRHIVDLLMQDSCTDLNLANPSTSTQVRLHGALMSMTMLERNMYKMADTLSEYYRMLAAKKWEIEMDIEERKRSGFHQVDWVMENRITEQ